MNTATIHTRVGRHGHIIATVYVEYDVRAARKSHDFWEADDPAELILDSFSLEALEIGDDYPDDGFIRRWGDFALAELSRQWDDGDWDEQIWRHYNG